MNPELAAFQQKLDAYQDEFYQLLREYARIRKISPRVRAESSKILEQYLIRMNRMVKQVSREFNDDLLQGRFTVKNKNDAIKSIHSFSKSHEKWLLHKTDMRLVK